MIAGDLKKSDILGARKFQKYLCIRDVINGRVLTLINPTIAITKKMDHNFRENLFLPVFLLICVLLEIKIRPIGSIVKEAAAVEVALKNLVYKCSRKKN